VGATDRQDMLTLLLFLPSLRVFFALHYVFHRTFMELTIPVQNSLRRIKHTAVAYLVGDLDPLPHRFARNLLANVSTNSRFETPKHMKCLAILGG
jgi:hypothetical protein